jgi:hypothetical protein
MQLPRLVTIAFALSMAATVGAQTFAFGLWGDMPYQKANDGPKMQALIDSINASDIAFSIFDGDIKDGSSKCTDDVYTDALAMFAKFTRPTVYIPGDNEWTDCHRLNNGGYDNLERLAHVRNVMFPTPDTLGRATMSVERQGKRGEKFVENVRFVFEGIVFVGLNVPGSNNNRVLDAKDCANKSARTPAQCEADNAEYIERDAANIQWMQEAFAMAKERKAAGLVIVFQADPGFDLPETEEIDETKAPEFSGYRNFMDRMVAETERYSGQVLMVHGDTHFFKIDMPLYSPTKLLRNFTRLQTFGSPSIHWVKVSVDPRSPRVFAIEPIIVKQN